MAKEPMKKPDIREPRAAEAKGEAKKIQTPNTGGMNAAPSQDKTRNGKARQ